MDPPDERTVEEASVEEKRSSKDYLNSPIEVTAALQDGNIDTGSIPKEANKDTKSHLREGTSKGQEEETEEEAMPKSPQRDTKGTEDPVEDEIKRASQETAPVVPSVKEPDIEAKPSEGNPAAAVHQIATNRGTVSKSVPMGDVIKGSPSDTESDEESPKKTADPKKELRMGAAAASYVEGSMGSKQPEIAEKDATELLKKIASDSSTIESRQEMLLTQSLNEGGDSTISAAVEDKESTKDKMEQPKADKDSTIHSNGKKAGLESLNDIKVLPNIREGKSKKVDVSLRSSAYKLPVVNKKMKVTHKREWRPKKDTTRVSVPPTPMSAQAAMASISQIASRMNTTGEVQRLSELAKAKKEEEIASNPKFKTTKRRSSLGGIREGSTNKVGRPKNFSPSDSSVSRPKAKIASLVSRVDYESEGTAEYVSTNSNDKKRTTINYAHPYGNGREQDWKRQKKSGGNHFGAESFVASSVQGAALVPVAAETSSVFSTIQTHLSELLAHPHILQAIGMNPQQLQIAAGLLAGGLPYATAAAAAAKNAQHAAVQQSAMQQGSVFFAAAQQRPVQQFVAHPTDMANAALQRMANIAGNSAYYSGNFTANQGPSVGAQNGVRGGYPGERQEFDSNAAMHGQGDPIFSHIRSTSIQQQQRRGRRADPPADPPGADESHDYSNSH